MPRNNYSNIILNNPRHTKWCYTYNSIIKKAMFDNIMRIFHDWALYLKLDVADSLTGFQALYQINLKTDVYF